MRILVLPLLMLGCGNKPEILHDDEVGLCLNARCAYHDKYEGSDVGVRVFNSPCRAVLHNNGEAASVIVDLRWERKVGGRSVEWRRDWTCSAQWGGVIRWQLDKSSCWLSDEWLDVE